MTYDEMQTQRYVGALIAVPVSIIMSTGDWLRAFSYCLCWLLAYGLWMMWRRVIRKPLLRWIHNATR